MVAIAQDFPEKKPTHFYLRIMLYVREEPGQWLVPLAIHRNFSRHMEDSSMNMNAEESMRE